MSLAEFCIIQRQEDLTHVLSLVLSVLMQTSYPIFRSVVLEKRYGV